MLHVKLPLVELALNMPCTFTTKITSATWTGGGVLSPVPELYVLTLDQPSGETYLSGIMALQGLHRCMLPGSA